MSEENRKQNVELNEAELDGVSGGGILDDPNYKIAKMERLHCNLCRAAGCRCEGGSKQALYEYVARHGEIRNYRDCPFCKP